MWKKVALGAGCLVLILLTGALVVIGPRNIAGMWKYDSRREGDFKVGMAAPDVALIGLDGARVSLKDRLAGGRPTVLIFGSFT